MKVLRELGIHSHMVCLTQSIWGVSEFTFVDEPPYNDAGLPFTFPAMDRYGYENTVKTLGLHQYDQGMLLNRFS